MAASLAVLVFVGCRLFPTREKRLWEFVDRCRDALLEARQDEFLACFDPAVRYQDKGGLAEIKRDYGRYHAVGVPRPTILAHEATLDDEGADLRMEVVLSAGFNPLGRYVVRLRALDDGGGPWRFTKVRWE